MRMTTAEVNAYEARRIQGLHGTKAVSIAVEEESLLHNQIIAECKRRGWIYFHSRMDKPTGATIGTPDFILAADGGRTFFIECKSATGKLSTAQLGMQVWAKKLNHEIHVIRSFEEFIQLTTQTQ